MSYEGVLAPDGMNWTKARVGLGRKRMGLRGHLSNTASSTSLIARRAIGTSFFSSAVRKHC